MPNPSNVNFPLGQRGIFIPALGGFGFPDGTWTLTRVASGQYVQRKTAAAGTTHPFIDLSQAITRVASQGSFNVALGSEIESGGGLTGFDLIYAVNTAALTSFTPQLFQVAFANGVAVAGEITTPATPSPAYTIGVNEALTAITVAPLGGANANPFCVRFALNTPYFVGNNKTCVGDYLEIAIVDPGTSVVDLYGAILLYTDNR